MTCLPTAGHRVVARRLDGAVGEGVGAELLDDGDVQGEPVTVADDLDRLGPEPDDDAVRALPPQRLERRTGEWELGSRRCGRVPSSIGKVSRFIPGDPMKPATNTFAGNS